MGVYVPAPADCWGRRLYGLKEAVCPRHTNSTDTPPFEKRLRRATKALFTDGRATTRRGVRETLASTGPDQPEHVWAAFALAYFDLDYEEGTTILLRYLRAAGPPGQEDLTAERRVWNNVRDPFWVHGYDLPWLFYSLYQRHADTAILQGLMQMMSCGDGLDVFDLKTALAAALEEHPRDFVRALARLAPERAEDVCRRLGADDSVGPKMIAAERRGLGAEARRKGSARAAAARQALTWFEQGLAHQKRAEAQEAAAAARPEDRNGERSAEPVPFSPRWWGAGEG